VGNHVGANPAEQSSADAEYDHSPRFARCSTAASGPTWYMPVLLTFLLKRLEGFLRFPQFRVKFKRLLISSLGFWNTALLLEYLA